MHHSSNHNSSSNHNIAHHTARTFHNQGEIFNNKTKNMAQTVPTMKNNKDLEKDPSKTNQFHQVNNQNTNIVNVNIN